MTSSANSFRAAAAALTALAVLAWGTTAGAAPSVRGALAAPSRETGPGERITVRARGAIAERWGVDPNAIVIEWGTTPGVLAPELAEAPLRLAGRGADGRFALVLVPEARRVVALLLRAGLGDSVPVAARALEQGRRLEQEDLRLEGRVHWGPPLATAPERAGLGWELRRPVAAGEPLVIPVVQSPQLVEAGDCIRLVWERGTVSVAMEGTALQSARRGETISARVPGRTDRVRGVVVARGTAELISEVIR